MTQWVRVGGSGLGNIVKWTEPGQCLEGIYRGLTAGRYGDLGVLEKPDGSQVKFPTHTVLLDRLKRIRQGAEVRIEYLGKTTGKKGQEFKDFDVSVADATDILPAEESEEDLP